MTRPTLLALPILLGALAFSPSAEAMKMIYSLNAGLNKPILDDGNDYEGGMNIELVGQLPVPFPFFNVELEAKLGANTFTRVGGGDNAMLLRGSVGLRGGVNFAAYPYGFVHVGWGSLSGPWAHSADSVGAPIGEIGIGLDVTALPYVRIGLFGAYNHMMIGEDVKLIGSTDRDLQWFSVGLKLGWVSDE